MVRVVGIVVPCRRRRRIVHPTSMMVRAGARTRESDGAVTLPPCTRPCGSVNPTPTFVRSMTPPTTHPLEVPNLIPPVTAAELLHLAWRALRVQDLHCRHQPERADVPPPPSAAMGVQHRLGCRGEPPATLVGVWFPHERVSIVRGAPFILLVPAHRPMLLSVPSRPVRLAEHLARVVQSLPPF